jgi:DNA-binding response OmpR family regulator
LEVTNKAKVLCVEDNPDECDLVRAILDGFDVVCVPTIADARRDLRNQDFDLLLVDEHLPDGSGLSLCREMQASGMKVPVIVISGDTFITCAEAEAAGARTFIPKSRPSYVEDLQEAAHQLVLGAGA